MYIFGIETERAVVRRAGSHLSDRRMWGSHFQVPPKTLRSGPCQMLLLHWTIHPASSVVWIPALFFQWSHRPQLPNPSSVFAARRNMSTLRNSQLFIVKSQDKGRNLVFVTINLCANSWNDWARGTRKHFSKTCSLESNYHNLQETLWRTKTWTFPSSLVNLRLLPTQNR